VVLPNIRFLRPEVPNVSNSIGKGAGDVPSGEDVFDCDSEGVADVEAPVDGRWGERNDEEPLSLGVAVFGQLRLEETLRVPPVVPSRLDVGGIIAVGGRKRVWKPFSSRKLDIKQHIPFSLPTGNQRAPPLHRGFGSTNMSERLRNDGVEDGGKLERVYE
jgi:hypothetical protein